MIRRSFGHRAVQLLLDPELRRRADAYEEVNGDRYDCFGAHPDGWATALAITRPFYDYYFRVDSHGAERIPQEGAAILCANHSGTLPFDAFMLHADILRRSDPPRVPRTVMDRFVPRLPFFSTLAARAGAISGTRRNVEHVLRTGQLLVVFPEGTPGIGKPFRDRYRLQPFRVGHAELAIRHRAPVVPVAIVGAEEQMPTLTRLDRIRLFGAPYLPVPLTPFPLPVRYHIHYGESVFLNERFGDDARDPQRVEAAARFVREKVQELVNHGLRSRPGIFR